VITTEPTGTELLKAYTTRRKKKKEEEAEAEQTEEDT
jgi:hypothetical protein